MLRKRPNVTSWRTLLETAMSEHAGSAVEPSKPEHRSADRTESGPSGRARERQLAAEQLADRGESPSRSCTSVASAGRTAVATSG